MIEVAVKRTFSCAECNNLMLDRHCETIDVLIGALLGTFI